MVPLCDVAMLLLCVAVTGLHVLAYLLPISPHNPDPPVSATAGAVTLPAALAIAHFTAVTLIYLRVAPAPAPLALVSEVALRLLAAMACALLLLLVVMPLVPWLCVVSDFFVQ